MAFDDIPEDLEQSEPCQCGGNIKHGADGIWRCDTCSWSSDTGEEYQTALQAACDGLTQTAIE